MRKATAAAVFPIGWPPLNELREKVVAKHIPVLLVRILFPGPWGHGERSGGLGREVRQPRCLRLAGEWATRL